MLGGLAACSLAAWRLGGLEDSLKGWNSKLLKGRMAWRPRGVEAGRLGGRVACSLKAWRHGG